MGNGHQRNATQRNATPRHATPNEMMDDHDRRKEKSFGWIAWGSSGLEDVETGMQSRRWTWTLQYCMYLCYDCHRSFIFSPVRQPAGRVMNLLIRVLFFYNKRIFFMSDDQKGSDSFLLHTLLYVNDVKCVADPAAIATINHDVLDYLAS